MHRKRLYGLPSANPRLRPLSGPSGGRPFTSSSQPRTSARPTKFRPGAASLNQFYLLTVHDEVRTPSPQLPDDEDRDMWSFMFAEPVTEFWEDDDDTSEGNSSVLSLDKGPITPALVMPTRSTAEVIQDKVAFLEYFNLPTCLRYPEAILRLTLSS